jgi:hypothetical protein
VTGIEAIAQLFAGPGARDYLGEAVTIGERMRQAGALAEAAGAPAPLGRRGQRPLGHPAGVRSLRGVARGSSRAGSAQLLGVRESALTATELRTLNATAPPR